MSKRLHAVLNLGLTAAAILTFTSPLRPTFKFPLLAVLAIAAQRHATRQELLLRDYQTGIADTLEAVLQEGETFAGWVRGYLPAPQDGPPKGILSRIALDGYRDLLQATTPPASRYSRLARKSVVFCGNSGEGKTVAAHYALSGWYDQEPSLISLWFDPNLGVNDNPNYASNWLGIPQFPSLPRDIQTGVYKGSAPELEAFIDLFCVLLAGRIRDNLNAPPVLMGIEELSHQLRDLDEASRERINISLSRLATVGRKYGLFIWLVLHTLTKEEMLVDRMVVRQCHIVMGVEMAQDRVQVSNSPRALPPTAVLHGQKKYREQGGVPAGFITSLPVDENYLPVPPLASLTQLVRDWQEPGQSPLEQQFQQALEQSDIQQALQAYLAGTLKDATGKDKPKAYLFRLIWGTGMNGQRKEERGLLDAELHRLKQTPSDAEPSSDSPLADPNRNGHSPTVALSTPVD